ARFTFPTPPEARGGDMLHPDNTKPYRVGVFRSVAEADQVVRDLLAAGISGKEIAVVCSAPHKEAAVHGGERPKPDVDYPMRAIGTGAGVGAIGGLALAALAVATGGVGVAAPLAVLVGGGAIGGAF